MNIEIRKATEEDLLPILSLYAQPEMDGNKVLSIDEARTLFKKMVSYPSYNIFVAVIKNNIFALLIMDNLAHMGAPSGVVEDVAVDPTYQGKGIGKIMMHFAMKICKESGCYKLVLSSNIKELTHTNFMKHLGLSNMV